MTKTLESAASPKHEALVYALNLHGLKLDRIVEQNDKLIELNTELNKTEKGRSEFDVVTHDQWKEAKKKAAHATWMQVFIGMAALAVAMGGLYSGAIELNRDNPAIIMIHDAYKEIERAF